MATSVLEVGALPCCQLNAAMGGVFFMLLLHGYAWNSLPLINYIWQRYSGGGFP